MGAITATKIEHNIAGNRRSHVYTLTGSTSYATLGDTLTPAQVGLQRITQLQVELPISSTPACRGATYDHTNNKLIFFDQAFAEIAAGVDLSTFSGRANIFGY